MLKMTPTITPAKFRPEANPPTANRAQLCSADACAVTSGERGSEVSLTIKPMPGEGIADLFNRLAGMLEKLNATILHLTIFGSISANATAMEAMQRRFGKIDWPVTWIEGAACDGNPIAGLQIFGFTGGTVDRISLDGRVVGSVFNDGAARHCLLGGLGPVRNSISRPDQTKETLDNLALALAQGGFSLTDTVRTWFFLDDLLSWYDEFNRTRTRIYSGVNFRTDSLPASTGIGAKNPAGDALTVGAWAMRPLDSSARQATTSHFRHGQHRSRWKNTVAERRAQTGRAVNAGGGGDPALARLSIFRPDPRDGLLQTPRRCAGAHGMVPGARFADIACDGG